MSTSHPTSRRGITMAETIISTLLVAFVLVGTIQIVGPVVRSGSVMADKAIATSLARELSEEISTKYFTAPGSADLETLAPGMAETRSTYNDIDDYNGLSNSPPQLSDGTKLANLAGWTRSVKVEHMSLIDPSSNSRGYSGGKRVTVTVSKDGVQLAEIVTLHTHAADQIGFVLQEP
ncbi:MAG: hypothetical protein ACF8MF_00170 [Phycisphaerales bacterium JB052]